VHPLLTHANALRTQLPPRCAAAVRPAILRIYGADVNQKCFVAEVAPLGNTHPTCRSVRGTPETLTSSTRHCTEIGQPNLLRE